MSLRVTPVADRIIRAPGAWVPASAWYREARVSEDCLDPETPKRVAGCWCRLCQSKLTDPAIVGMA